MQPTDHKHKEGVELIAHIKQSLKTHEEVYQIGAWEKFSETQQVKKRPLFWLARVSAAAAILAICFTLIWVATNGPEGQQVAHIKEATDILTPKSQPFKGEQVQQEQLTTASTQRIKSGNRLIANVNPAEDVVKLPTISPTVQADVTGDKLVIKGTTSQIDPQIIANVDAKVKPDIVDFLASETQKGEGKLDKLALNKKRKWDMGLMLAPSFGSTKELNMGYGVSMAYNFSDRLSLTSGIAYNKMNASKSIPTSIGMSSIVLGNTRSLEMISEEVTGLDIPLELRYHVNKHVYANVGVSGFAVLNHSRRNTFVETVVIKSNVNATSSTGISSGTPSASSEQLDAGPKGQFANSYIVNQRTTEKASSAAMQDVNYLGFYNLSFGYTKRIYKNHALSIEPFVKLPIKMVTQDNLRLVGTGVRLKVGF